MIVIPIRETNHTPVRIHLAGRVTVESTCAIVDERLLYGRQAWLTFALLVMERYRPVPREELAEAVWPHGRPRTCGAALRGVVSKVRAFLTIAGLSENPSRFSGFGTYQLHLPADVVVDVECAVRLMVLGSQPGPAGQLAALLWDTGR